jgi:hypothetical protein
MSSNSGASSKFIDGADKIYRSNKSKMALIQERRPLRTCICGGVYTYTHLLRFIFISVCTSHNALAFTTDAINPTR